MKKSTLKSIIKHIIKESSNDFEFKDGVETPMKAVNLQQESDEESFYLDAQAREDDAKNARERLELIDKAGLTTEYETLMKDIFKQPIKEFDRRALAIGQLEKKAREIVKQQKITEMSSTGGVAGYSTPFAFTKNKKGSPKGIEAAKKYGKVVGEAPRV